MIVEDVTKVSLDNDLKFPDRARVSDARFDYMFEDADEDEVTTTHDNDQDSLGKSTCSLHCQSTLTNSITVPDEMVKDEGNADPEDFGPFTPRQLFLHLAQASPVQFVHHHHAPPMSTPVLHGHNAQVTPANQVLDLTGIDLADVHAHTFLQAGIPITITGKSE